MKLLEDDECDDAENQTENADDAAEVSYERQGKLTGG